MPALKTAPWKPLLVIHERFTRLKVFWAPAIAQETFSLPFLLSCINIHYPGIPLLKYCWGISPWAVHSSRTPPPPQQLHVGAALVASTLLCIMTEKTGSFLGGFTGEMLVKPLANGNFSLVLPLWGPTARFQHPLFPEWQGYKTMVPSVSTLHEALDPLLAQLEQNGYSISPNNFSSYSEATPSRDELKPILHYGG